MQDPDEGWDELGDDFVIHSDDEEEFKKEIIDEETKILSGN